MVLRRGSSLTYEAEAQFDDVGGCRNWAKMLHYALWGSKCFLRLLKVVMLLREE